MNSDLSAVDRKLLLSKREAAWLLSLSVRSIDYLIARGELPVRRVGKRVLIPQREMERFIRRDHVTVVPPSRGGANSSDGTREEAHLE